MSRPAVTVCPRVIAVQCLQGDDGNEGNLSLGSHCFFSRSGRLGLTTVSSTAVYQKREKWFETIIVTVILNVKPPSGFAAFAAPS
jgi:hypothetical protein